MQPDHDDDDEDEDERGITFNIPKKTFDKVRV